MGAGIEGRTTHLMHSIIIDPALGIIDHRLWYIKHNQFKPREKRY